MTLNTKAFQHQNVKHAYYHLRVWYVWLLGYLALFIHASTPNSTDNFDRWSASGIDSSD